MSDKNYMTPSCFEKMSSEMSWLVKEERPRVTEIVKWAASLGDRSENADYLYAKKRIREIDKRINFLNKRLEKSEVINPSEVQSEVVQFGATVTIELDGEEVQYSIVGVDESNVKLGLISWKSPIGRGLLGKSIGDEVLVRSPNGIREIEIIDIQYIPIEVNDEGSM